jgi:hypothetical protein
MRADSAINTVITGIYNENRERETRRRVLTDLHTEETQRTNREKREHSISSITMIFINRLLAQSNFSTQYQHIFPTKTTYEVYYGEPWTHQEPEHSINKEMIYTMIEIEFLKLSTVHVSHQTLDYFITELSEEFPHLMHRFAPNFTKDVAEDCFILWFELHNITYPAKNLSYWFIDEKNYYLIINNSDTITIKREEIFRLHLQRIAFRLYEFPNLNVLRLMLGISSSEFPELDMPMQNTHFKRQDPVIKRLMEFYNLLRFPYGFAIATPTNYLLVSTSPAQIDIVPKEQAMHTLFKFFGGNNISATDPVSGRHIQIYEFFTHHPNISMEIRNDLIRYLGERDDVKIIDMYISYHNLTCNSGWLRGDFYYLDCPNSGLIPGRYVPVPRMVVYHFYEQMLMNVDANYLATNFPHLNKYDTQETPNGSQPGFTRAKRGLQFLGDLFHLCCNLISTEQLSALKQNQESVQMYMNLLRQNMDNEHQQLLQYRTDLTHIEQQTINTFKNVQKELGNVYDHLQNDENVISQIIQAQSMIHKTINSLSGSLSDQAYMTTIQNCRAHKLSENVVTRSILATDLLHLQNNLYAISNSEFDLLFPVSDLESYYTYSLVDCNIPQQQVDTTDVIQDTTIVLKVPIIKRRDKWTLYKIQTLPYQIEQGKVCTLKDLPHYVLMNQNSKTLEPVSQELQFGCTQAQNDQLCYKPQLSFTFSRYQQCLETLFYSPENDKIDATCKLECYKYEKPIVMQQALGQYIVTNVNKIKIICGKTRTETVKELPHYGLLQLSLPCRSEVFYNNTSLFTVPFPCTDTVEEVRIKHIIPAQVFANIKMTPIKFDTMTFSDKTALQSALKNQLDYWDLYNTNNTFHSQYQKLSNMVPPTLLEWQGFGVTLTQIWTAVLSLFVGIIFLYVLYSYFATKRTIHRHLPVNTLRQKHDKIVKPTNRQWNKYLSKKKAAKYLGSPEENVKMITKEDMIFNRMEPKIRADIKTELAEMNSAENTLYC